MALIFTRREWDGRAIELGELWVLRKGPRTARASVATHPRGVELRLEIDGELQPESRVFAEDDEPLFALAAAWRALLEAKGWRARGA
ncbi:MAG TPA: hypothetical protein VM364_07885 [Vicinamibacterales bacterium]|nr:hypothetical protein [Vicinamibacterales bacterium]